MVARQDHPSRFTRWRATPPWVYGAAMAEDEPAPAHAAVPSRPEPPLIERARRTGWVLLGIALITAVGARMGPQEWSFAAWAVALAAALAGLLAIVNVALVRGLYRDLAVRREAEDQPPASP
jgi:hypothetical protein